HSRGACVAALCKNRRRQVGPSRVRDALTLTGRKKKRGKRRSARPLRPLPPPSLDLAPSPAPPSSGRVQRQPASARGAAGAPMASSPAAYELVAAAVASSPAARANGSVWEFLAALPSAAAGAVDEASAWAAPRRSWRLEHPHALHQLVNYSVYASWDRAAGGSPPFWLPSTIVLNNGSDIARTDARIFRDMLSNKVYDGSVRGHNDEILSQAANKHRPWSVDMRMVHWEVFIRKEGRKISQETQDKNMTRNYKQDLDIFASASPLCYKNGRTFMYNISSKSIHYCW
ncbi:hypothetical protein EJB05_08239, partial [Eragrostis curvula]